MNYRQPTDGPERIDQQLRLAGSHLFKQEEVNSVVELVRLMGASTTSDSGFLSLLTHASVLPSPAVIVSFRLQPSRQDRSFPASLNRRKHGKNRLISAENIIH